MMLVAAFLFAVLVVAAVIQVAFDEEAERNIAEQLRRANWVRDLERRRALRKNFEATMKKTRKEIQR